MLYTFHLDVVYMDHVCHYLSAWCVCTIYLNSLCTIYLDDTIYLDVTSIVYLPALCTFMRVLYSNGYMGAISDCIADWEQLHPF